MGPEEELDALAGLSLLPPFDEPLDEPPLVGRVARGVAGDEGDGAPRIEPGRAQERLVVRARSSPVEEVGLGPTRHPHPVGLDPMVEAQVLLHHVVLDDVALAVRRDDALPDRMVPARDVGDDRKPEPARGRENGTALAGWAFESTTPEHSRRMASRSRLGMCRRGLKNHRCIARSTRGQRGSGPSRSLSSIQFGCPGCIRSVWNPCRWFRRIASGWYPRLPVEPRVDPPESHVREPARRRQRRSVQCGEPGHPARPLPRLVRLHEEDRGEPAAESLLETGDYARVEERADREQVGEDEPGPGPRSSSRDADAGCDPSRRATRRPGRARGEPRPACRTRATPRRRTR